MKRHLAAAILGTVGGCAVDVDPSPDVDFAAAPYALTLCDTLTPDVTRTLTQSPVTVGTGTAYGTRGCTDFILRANNRAPDGLPIVEQADITTVYTSALPTTKVGCEGKFMRVRLQECNAAGTSCSIVRDSTVRGIWNGTSCRMPGISFGQLLSANGFRVFARAGTDMGLPNRAAMSITITPL